MVSSAHRHRRAVVGRSHRRHAARNPARARARGDPLIFPTVTGRLQRRFKVLLAAAATATVAWLWLPGTALDRAAFSAVARGFANPPFFISGNGSHAGPWKLRTFVSHAKPDSRQSPVIVSLGDDPEGVFQSSPPSPIDLAVILANFQRLGAKKAATAAVLAWDAPDPIGLTALDKAISRFDSLVMAAPLSRGAVPEPMPPAFRRASIARDKVHGDVSSLPVVNRIPIPGIILGKENTLAGFQLLESEPATDFPPLLARWEDRIVFSFPLLTVLQGLELPLDGIEIRPGQFLKLSPDGPILPIDQYGRLTIPLKPLAPGAEIPAEALIDGGDELFPKQAPGSVILRDLRSAAEPATRAYSRQLPALIATITSAGLAPEHEFCAAFKRMGNRRSPARQPRLGRLFPVGRFSPQYRVSHHRRILHHPAIHRRRLRNDLAARLARTRCAGLRARRFQICLGSSAHAKTNRGPPATRHRRSPTKNQSGNSPSFARYQGT